MLNQLLNFLRKIYFFKVTLRYFSSNPFSWKSNKACFFLVFFFFHTKSEKADNEPVTATGANGNV